MAKKTISLVSYNKWEDELKQNFIHEEQDGKVYRLKCKVCSKHCESIKAKYRGKVVEDVMNYGKHGTTHILKPNLVRHMASEAHRRCLELETHQPQNKRQKTITQAYGGAVEMAKKSLTQLLRAALYLCSHEKPYSEYPHLLSMCGDMGLNLTTSYNNEKAAKAFGHVIANQMVSDVRQRVGRSNFYSWLIDGSTAAKRRLTYEAELIYIRTAFELCPRTELLCFKPMKPYASVNSANLLHALLCELLSLDPSVDASVYMKDVDEVPIESLIISWQKSDLSKKNIGAAADGAAVNFGCNKGLVTTVKKTFSQWLVGLHCFSHRLELAAHDALRPHFEEVDVFLQEIFLHFRNSALEWCLVLKLADRLNIGVYTQPKSFGTRFLPHTKKALSALRNNWMVYTMHFQNQKASSDNVQAAKASAWLDKLMSCAFIMKCRVYEDIVVLLSRTANVFQADQAQSVSDAQQKFKTMKAEQEILSEQPGESENDLWTRIQQSDPVHESDIAHVRSATRSQPTTSSSSSCKVKLGIKVLKQVSSTNAQTSNQAASSRSKFVEADSAEPLVIKHMVTKETITQMRKTAMSDLNTKLADRYSQFEEVDDVLSKIQFVDITSWPEDLRDLSNFGVEDVSWLLKHFQKPLQHAGIIGEVEVLQEFRDFKMHYGPKLSAGQITKNTSDVFWPWVYSTNKAKYRNVLLVVEIILCIPFSTAIVERGFSAVRRIITDWRSTLGEDLISDCMHFSTRKGQLQNVSYKEKLICDAASSFLEGIETESWGDLAAVTRRRVNMLQKGLKLDEKSNYTQVIVTEESRSSNHSDSDDELDTADVMVINNDSGSSTTQEAELLSIWEED